ncbi:MAG: hypothetical protein MI757_04420 [Pirellulales bacterium]|nr:hypothetical protein [Pirellulales bacterium]
MFAVALALLTAGAFLVPGFFWIGFLVAPLRTVLLHATAFLEVPQPMIWLFAALATLVAGLVLIYGSILSHQQTESKRMRTAKVVVFCQETLCCINGLQLLIVTFLSAFVSR